MLDLILLPSVNVKFNSLYATTRVYRSSLDITVYLSLNLPWPPPPPPPRPFRNNLTANGRF